MKPSNNCYIYLNPPPAPPFAGPLAWRTVGGGYQVDCPTNDAGLAVGQQCWISFNPASTFNKAVSVECTVLAPPTYTFVDSP